MATVAASPVVSHSPRQPLDEHAREEAIAAVARMRDEEEHARDLRLRMDKFRADEERFNNKRPPVYEMRIRNELQTQSDILAAASTDAAALIASLHTQCFGAIDAPPGPINLVERGMRIIDKTWDEILNMDQQSVSILFHAKITALQYAITYIKRDEKMPEQTKVQIFSASKATSNMLTNMDCTICALLTAERCVQTSMNGGFKSDKDASWRYIDCPASGKEGKEGKEDEEGKMNAVQLLYRIALEEAFRLKYARYKDGFMRRIVTADGGVTTAWERVCSFKEFVYGLTEMPNGQIQQLTSKSANIMDNVADLLSKKREAHVPWITPDRHVFSFANGVYLAKDELFIPYVRTGPPVQPGGKACPTACSHHDVKFDIRWVLDTPDWYNIPTPLVDKIMDTQELPIEVKRWYYVMLGRALYDLGELDNWQIILYILGMGESGKSTLLKFFASFYNFEDVGILSDNIEGLFGASMLVGKFVIIGDDLGEKFSLNQQLFQNIVSGNFVSLAQKNRDALVLLWKTQLLLSGNVIPDYRDNAASFSRRLLVINYAKIPRRPDPTLLNRLKVETAAMITKCNRAYRNMVRRVEAAAADPVNPLGLWDILPEEFMTQRRNVAQCANSLMSFMNSGKLVFGRSLYMPRELFLAQFKQHCQSTGMPMTRFTPPNFTGPFSAMDLTMTSTRTTRLYPRGPNGQMMSEIYIDGVDLATATAISESSRDLTEIASQAAEAAAAFAAARVNPYAAAAVASSSRFKRSLAATSPSDQSSPPRKKAATAATLPKFYERSQAQSQQQHP